MHKSILIGTEAHMAANKSKETLSLRETRELLRPSPVESTVTSKDKPVRSRVLERIRANLAARKGA